MSTEPVSPSDVEKTRRAGARVQAGVLQRLAEITQERAGEFMGVSGSTVSRIKDDLDKTCQLLAALGFQLAPTDAVVVDQREQVAIESLALKYLQARQETWRRRD